MSRRDYELLRAGLAGDVRISLGDAVSFAALGYIEPRPGRPGEYDVTDRARLAVRLFAAEFGFDETWRPT